MEDELDFESLQEILDDGDADIGTIDSTSTNTQTDSRVAGSTAGAETGESSDDDIDEDELDKLAALVEAGDEKPPSTSHKPDHGEKSEEIHDEKVPTPKQEPEVNYKEKMDELKAMQDKIKQLEEELLKKSLEVEKKSSPEHTATTCNTKPATKTVKKGSSESADIFGAALTRSDTAPDGKVKRKAPSPKQSPAHRVQSSKTTTDKSQTRKGVPHPKLSNPNDSDSDWEGLDGEKPSSLSKEGREIKKLLTSGPRVAHTPKYDPSEVKVERKEYKYNASWKDKPSTSMSGTGKSNTTAGQSQLPTDSDAKVISEPFSGIRVINPLVSSAQMKSMMQGRRNIHISKIHTRTKAMDTDSDWVTIGVVVSKTEPKKSAKGNNYSIWRLSDLDDCDKTVNFFLFNKVYQEHWKTTPGSVIGLLNPSIMQKEENRQNQDPSITIENAKKLLLIGKSKDMGRCRAKTKAGSDCTNFINVTRGEYCTYHVQSAYKKSSSKRSELQAGFSGVVPKSFEKNLFNKGGTVIYGGQSFSTTGHSGTTTKKSKAVSIKSLQQHHLKTGAQDGTFKVSTLQIHDILPEDRERLQALKEDKNEKFHAALSVPTAGSMNYVKHLKVQENVKEKQKEVKVVHSISAQDFLKQSEKEMKARFGSSKHKSRQTNNPSESAPKAPSLGRGLGPGEDVLFDLDDFPSVPSPKVDLKAEQAKLKAIQKVKAKGGIQKSNPNSAKNLKSPTQQERIKRRLTESGSDNQDENEEASTRPPKKKSRVLGNLDLDDPEVQKLLNARSKHDGVLTEQEQEKMDLYFDPLEKKEAMEEKMRSITEVKCKAYSCKQCKYEYFAPRKECREQKHTILCRDAVKKFFQCKGCKHRTISLDKFPTHPCKKCGGDSYERCSMLKEKNGPKLPGEDLLLRGEEIKYLNSLK